VTGYMKKQTMTTEKTNCCMAKNPLRSRTKSSRNGSNRHPTYYDYTPNYLCNGLVGSNEHCSSDTLDHFFLLPLHYAAHVHHTWHLRNCVFHEPGLSVMFPLRFQSVEDIVFIMYQNYLDLIIHFKTDVTWLMFPPTPSTVIEHL
jgi:hypothetical protein